LDNATDGQVTTNHVASFVGNYRTRVLDDSVDRVPFGQSVDHGLLRGKAVARRLALLLCHVSAIAVDARGKAFLNGEVVEEGINVVDIDGSRRMRNDDRPARISP
jgi:hypothetical protein